jgi:hypothetical protein
MPLLQCTLFRRSGSTGRSGGGLPNYSALAAWTGGLDEPTFGQGMKGGGLGEVDGGTVGGDWDVECDGDMGLSADVTARGSPHHLGQVGPSHQA